MPGLGDDPRLAAPHLPADVSPVRQPQVPVLPLPLHLDVGVEVKAGDSIAEPAIDRVGDDQPLGAQLPGAPVDRPPRQVAIAVVAGRYTEPLFGLLGAHIQRPSPARDSEATPDLARISPVDLQRAVRLGPRSASRSGPAP